MDRHRGIRNVLLSTLIANFVVATAKLSYGYFTNSIGMISDGFHSLFDGTSNVIGLIGTWVASHPPDSRHPYGHRKYETLFTLIIASMIFFTSYQILRRVYELFQDDRKTVVTTVSFAIMVITMAVNISVMLYESRRGKELGSDFLIADAKHTKSDILTSCSVIVGLIFTRLGYPEADAVVAVFIAFFIAKIGYDILRSASDVLVDTVCIDTFELEAAVNRIEGVKGCHDIRTRGPAHAVFVDLHILVSPHLTTREAHDIADRVELAIKERFPEVADIVVHTEPDEVTR